jgi:hypothetical protein
MRKYASDGTLSVAENLGEIRFMAATGSNTGVSGGGGYDTATWGSAAMILGEIGTGTWEDGESNPGRLTFWTGTQGSNNLSERMRITSTGEITAPGLAGSIIGFWSDNPTSTATSGAPSAVYTYIKDASPASEYAVTFDAPPSGKVKITLGVTVNPYSATASTQSLYMAYSTSNSTTTPVAGSEQLVMTVPSDMDDAKLAQHQTVWIAEGLTGGATYTYYFMAKESNANDFTLLWGGTSGGLYGAGFIEVISLPA